MEHCALRKREIPRRKMEEHDFWESDWESEVSSSAPLYPVVQHPEPLGDLKIDQPLQEGPSTSRVPEPILSAKIGQGKKELPQRQAMSEPVGSTLEDERRRSREVERRLLARSNDLERVLRAQATVSIQTVKDLSSLLFKLIDCDLHWVASMSL